MISECDASARRLHEQLKRTGHRIVFAESCTAGLIAATLGKIPGISEWLVGSAVVYQLATKTEWLKVGSDVLESSGPVSQVVAEQMALGVLQATPHATISASITGHLGPGAPPEQDGTAWCSVAMRKTDNQVLVSRQLGLDAGKDSGNGNLRVARQHRAVALVMDFCGDVLV